MQVEMNGGIIVAIAIILIGVMGIGLAVYYIRKGREEQRQENAEADASDNGSSATNTDSSVGK